MHRLITYFRRGFCAIVFMAVLPVFSAFGVDCGSNQFKYTDSGTETCIDSKFEMDITGSGTKFSFYITAKGTFYIDWGDGTVRKKTIATVPSSTAYTNSTYKVESPNTYTSGNTYRIKIGGGGEYNATTNPDGIREYASSSTVPVFKINTTKTDLTGIYGSLGALFPTLTTGTTKQPRFYQSFTGCTGLTSSLPADLFVGLTGVPVANMFYGTFSGCTGLKGWIPNGLFAGFTELASAVFRDTFNGCKELEGPLPNDLFSGLTGNILSSSNGANAFYQMFSGCEKLTGSISSDLFSGLSGTISSSNAFFRMFYNCKKLSGFVPVPLFGNATPPSTTGPISGMFSGSGLDTECPAGTYEFSGYSTYYNSWGYKVACKLCEANYYSDSNASACTACPDGTHSPAGSTSVSMCCADGYDWDGNECKANCPQNEHMVNNVCECVGDMERNAGTGICELTCPSGFTNQDTDATTFEQCYKTTTPACVCSVSNGNCSYYNSSATATCTQYYGHSESCDYTACGTMTMTCNVGYDYDEVDNSCVIHTYTIDFELNGGTLPSEWSNPQTYNVNKLPLTLPTPTTQQSGYSFDGWYKYSDFSGSAITQITTNNIGDKTLYAHWVQCPENEHMVNNVCVCDGDMERNAGTGICELTCPSGFTNQDTDATTFEQCYQTDMQYCSDVLPCSTKEHATSCSWSPTTASCKRYYDEDNCSTGAEQTCVCAVESGSCSVNVTGCATGYDISNNACVIHNYQITYNLNNGNCADNACNGDTYTVNTTSVTLPASSNLSKQGYDFVGWCTTNESNCSVVTSPYTPSTSNPANVTFYAKWTPKTITCASAGQYLPANSETCAACPTDSYCPNAANTQYTYTGSAQGATACPGAYPNSDGGITAVSEDSCYASGTQTCSQYNVCPDHATCSYANTTAACRTFYNTNTCVLENPNACDYTFTCNTGYEQNGSICEVVTCNGGMIILPDPPSNNSGTGLVKIVAWTDEGDCWQNNTTNTELRFCNGTSTTNFGVFDTNNYEFRVYFVNKGGAVSGYSRCSTDENTAHQYTAYAGGNPNGPVKNYSSGRYCWCQLSTYEKGTANNFVTYDITSDWISSGAGIMSSASACDSSCSELCAKRFADMENEPKELRRALYNSVKNACIIGCPYDATEQYNTTTETSTCSCLNNVQTWSSETNTCNCPQGYTKDDSSPENTTCVADNYNINYDNDGGACGGTNSPNCGPLTYTVEDAVSLDNPTKTHYKFDGWCKYDNSQNDGNACLVSDTAHYVQPQTNPASIIAIAAGSTGAKWFYAKYASFNIYYKCNINDETNKDIKMAPYLDTFTPESTDYGCTPEGYHFTGWVCKYRDGAGGAASSDLSSGSPYDKTVDAECIAQWAPNTININWWNREVGDTPDTQNTCDYGEPNDIDVPTAPERPGYTFGGWEIAD